MNPFQLAFNAIQVLPVQMQSGVTGLSAYAIIAAYFETIHGPMATVGVILGVLWVSLQIYGWLEKRFNWFGQGKK
jgi:hypothetical protein